MARGYGELPAIVTPGEAGSRTVEMTQGERIEIRVPHGFDSIPEFTVSTAALADFFLERHVINPRTYPAFGAGRQGGPGA